MIKTIPLILATLVLCSCEPMGIPPINIPANLASECDDAVILKDDSMASVAEAAYGNKISLEDCKEKHHLLVELINGK